MTPGRSFRFNLFCSLFVCTALSLSAQAPYRSKVWNPDLGNGTYKNPVLNADYSDPDVIRVGNDYYLVSSSFEDVPGLPILHSKDLVNWRIIGHALPRLTPDAHFSVPRHGEGVWAPSMRFHKGTFYIYYPDPDFGIYVITAKDAAGPWSAPKLVAAGKGLIDPCPLWDDDGKVYLAHAFAGSRAGIKSILAIKQLNAAGDSAIDAGLLVYDGHALDPTIEGPKLYKRNGYYYIFAPAGGVATGWQLVLRSKNIYGPYERKVVMDQGSSTVNGPHQGAWVTTPTGEDWFLHFQDKEAYGRVVHLQPMQWKNNWPVIGTDKDGDGKGEPVMVYRKPRTGMPGNVVTQPQESDEFNGRSIGVQWQWVSNPQATWAYADPGAGVLRLFSQKLPEGAANLWEGGQLLSQKFPADSFQATVKLTFMPNRKGLGERAGLAVMGLSYAAVAVRHTPGGNQLVFVENGDAGKGGGEKETVLTITRDSVFYFRVQVRGAGICRFQFATDGMHFTDAGTFTATVGKWKGAKLALFCTRTETTNDSGWADLDWFRVEPVQEKQQEIQVKKP